MCERDIHTETRISLFPVRDGFAAHYAAVNARLMRGKRPEPKPTPPRPVTPFAPDRQRVATVERMKRHMEAVRSPHKLFSAPIIEIEEKEVTAPAPTPEAILDALDGDERDWVAGVAQILAAHGETRRRLISHQRDANIVACRVAVAKYFRRRGWSYPRIGQFLNRDHSSVVHLLNPERAKARRAARLASKKASG